MCNNIQFAIGQTTGLYCVDIYPTNEAQLNETTIYHHYQITKVNSLSIIIISNAMIPVFYNTV